MSIFHKPKHVLTFTLGPVVSSLVDRLPPPVSIYRPPEPAPFKLIREQATRQARHDAGICPPRCPCPRSHV